MLRNTLVIGLTCGRVLSYVPGPGIFYDCVLNRSSFTPNSPNGAFCNFEINYFSIDRLQSYASGPSMIFSLNRLSEDSKGGLGPLLTLRT